MSHHLYDFHYLEGYDERINCSSHVTSSSPAPQRQTSTDMDSMDYVKARLFEKTLQTHPEILQDILQ